MDTLIAHFGTYDIYFDVTLLVALAGVVWTFARRAAEELYFLMSLRTRQIEFELQAREGVPEGITSLNLLFIRYGNDTYLANLASDRERYHGRLRNKVIQLLDAPPKGGAPIRVRMRVHKRLGTQFKFFVDVTGDPGPVVAYLEQHETICDVSCNLRPAIRIGDAPRHRIFFLLDRLDMVETVDGFTNNFIFPV
jgi:hypothetical protein